MAIKLTIGRLAKKANVNIETVRYYQRVNLIEEPVKPPSGFRIYNESVIDRIKFIKKAQHLGFSLSEIKDLLFLGDGNCSDVKELAKEKRDQVGEQIIGLTALLKELDNLIEACQLTEFTPNCALIDSIVTSSKSN